MWRADIPPTRARLREVREVTAMVRVTLRVKVRVKVRFWTTVLRWIAIVPLLTSTRAT